MVQWQFVCVLSFLTLIGCGDSDTGPDPSPVGDSNGINSSNASNNDEILRELRDQNKLLKEQSERLKEIDVAKDRSSEREKHIDTIAGSVAQLVNKHQQKIGRAINNAGGFASEKSAYNDLFNELRTLLKTETSYIEDEDKFRAAVQKKAEAWAKRKVGL
jgi:hypothetical protein